MALKTWTTNYPAAIDTVTEQPVLVNDDDAVDVSHLNSIGQAVRSLETRLGSNLLERGSIKYIASNIEQRAVKLTWASVTLFNITAWPGESATVPSRLQDGIWRSFTGTLTFNPAVTGEGGLDTGVEANVWYYLYLVPTVANDSLLCVRGSTTSPIAGGPTGYTNYRYIGAVINVSGNLQRFYHIAPSRFLWNETKYEVSNSTVDAAPVLRNLSYAPATALSAELRALLRQQNTSELDFRIWVNNGSVPTDTVATCVMYMYNKGDSWDFNQECGTVPCPVSPPGFYYRKTRTSGTLNWGAVFCAGWTDAYL